MLNKNKSTQLLTLSIVSACLFLGGCAAFKSFLNGKAGQSIINGIIGIAEDNGVNIVVPPKAVNLLSTGKTGVVCSVLDLNGYKRYFNKNSFNKRDFLFDCLECRYLQDGDLDMEQAKQYCGEISKLLDKELKRKNK